MSCFTILLLLDAVLIRAISFLVKSNVYVDHSRAEDLLLRPFVPHEGAQESHFLVHYTGSHLFGGEIE